MKIKKYFALLSAALILTVGFNVAGAEDKKEEPPPSYATYVAKELKNGANVEKLPALDLDGNEILLGSKLKSGLNIIMFTNSTCAACRSEASLLADLKKDKGSQLTVIGVLTDFSSGGTKNLEQKVLDNIDFIHDPEFKLPSSFGFQYTPATAFVKDGKLIDTKGGFRPGADEGEFISLVESKL